MKPRFSIILIALGAIVLGASLPRFGSWLHSKSATTMRYEKAR